MNHFASRNVERDFYFTLKRLSKNSVYYPDFSGIGLLLYDTGIFDSNWHTDLRPSIPCPRDVRLEEAEKVLLVLFTISKESHPLHDGFHLFDETGLMTHVAQYFFPPIVSELAINEKYGTRYHSAQYGSCISGITLTGIINCDNQHYVFRKGSLVQENEFG